MSTGTINKLVSQRGYGFINGDDGTEYFFHRDGVESPQGFDGLERGEKVTFEIEPSQKGPRAKRVQAS
jgi:CspA family cold shock protein